tara:strand:- start:1000 stop:1383 length:384 start_codon:yes stop_codon:yes gene_type:complete
MALVYGKLTLIGLASGLLAGLVGGGADAIIVPALMALNVTNNYKLAIGTSLATLLPPVGIFAVYNYYKKGDVNISYAFYLALMFTIGSYIMSFVGININKSMLRKIYAFFLIFLGIVILVDGESKYI